jgi:hypothetical protein
MGMLVLSTGIQLTTSRRTTPVAVFAYHDSLGLLKRVWDAEDYDGTIGPGEEHLCDLEDCIERSSEPGAHDDA